MPRSFTKCSAWQRAQAREGPAGDAASQHAGESHGSGRARPACYRALPRARACGVDPRTMNPGAMSLLTILAE